MWLGQLTGRRAGVDKGDTVTEARAGSVQGRRREKELVHLPGQGRPPPPHVSSVPTLTGGTDCHEGCRGLCSDLPSGKPEPRQLTASHASTKEKSCTLTQD